MPGVAVAKQICEAADQIDSAEVPLIEDTPISPPIEAVKAAVGVASCI